MIYIYYIRITSDPNQATPAAVPEIVHYMRRVELPDAAEAVMRLGRALDTELARPARKPRSDAGKPRTKETT